SITQQPPLPYNNTRSLHDALPISPMELNCLEKEVKKGIEANFKGRYLTIGRVANLTVPHKGRATCQHRNLCSRGCPYGAYFSTQASTLPAALATGNLTVRPHSVVSEVIFEKETGKASGVRVIDSQTNEVIDYSTKIVFLNASTLGTTAILLNSTSDHFPDGLGNSSGQLGRNLMDHHFRVGASGEYD